MYVKSWNRSEIVPCRPFHSKLGKIKINWIFGNGANLTGTARTIDRSNECIAAHQSRSAGYRKKELTIHFQIMSPAGRRTADRGTRCEAGSMRKGTSTIFPILFRWRYSWKLVSMVHTHTAKHWRRWLKSFIVLRPVPTTLLIIIIGKTCIIWLLFLMRKVPIFIVLLGLNIVGGIFEKKQRTYIGRHSESGYIIVFGAFHCKMRRLLASLRAFGTRKSIRSCLTAIYFFHKGDMALEKKVNSSTRQCDG